jgi:hypothetical protein
MEINLLSDSEKSRYDELAEKHGTVFSRLDWLKIFTDKVRIYGIYDKNGGIIGGFSIFTERRFGFKISRNPPFTPMIGPFLEIKAKNPVAIMNFWKEVLSLLANFLDKLPCSVISVSLSKEIVDTQPFVWKKFKVVPGYTYVVGLNEPIDNIRGNMSAEKRNDINKATRDGLLVEQVNNFEVVKSLVFKTFLRQELSVNKDYLSKILFEFATGDNSFAFVTFKDNSPIATSFCVYDKYTAYYLLGGYDYERKHHGAGALATWEAIKYAQQLGLKYFDFEGSMVPQIERYFRGFGGRLTPYYRINKAILPVEILLKFFKRELF